MNRKRIVYGVLSAALVTVVAAPSNTVSAAPTTLAAPVTSGSPDQPFGSRRPITDGDRALIASYRSKTPAFSTTFARPSDLLGWTFVVDDFAVNKSCRRAGAAETSNVGLRFKTLVAMDCKNHWATGAITSKAQYGYGFFEARLKIADIKGMNNAFWITSRDHYEIDVGEVRYPSYSHLGLQYWPVTKIEKHAGLGFGATFTGNLSYDFHDYGLLWTPNELIYEVDGEPIGALETHDAIKGPVNLLLSNALGDWANGPVPPHPEGHAMVVRSVRVTALVPGAP